MTLKEWADKNLGKALDWDGKYGAQCVDACRYYVRDVLNFDQFSPVGGAGEIFDIAQSDLYEKVENSPTGIPPYGSIVIWKKITSLLYGHVAICFDENATTSKFITLDQNWSGQVLTKETHDYTGVRGWLIPKKTAPSDWILKNSDNWRALVWYLELDTDPEHTDIAKIKSIIGGYKSRITDLENQVKQANQERDLANTEVANQKDKLANLQAVCQRDYKQLLDEYEALKKSQVDIDKIRGSYTGRISELEGQLRDAQKKIGELSLEITQLKGDTEVLSWIDKLVAWFKKRYN